MRAPPIRMLVSVAAAAMVILSCSTEVPETEPSTEPRVPGITPSEKDPDRTDDSVWRAPTRTLEDGITTRRVAPEILEALASQDSARVIVKLGLPNGYRSEGVLAADAVEAQRAEIAAAQLDLVGQIAERVRDRGISRFKRYSTLPYVALTGDKATLEGFGHPGGSRARVSAEEPARDRLRQSQPE